MKNKYFIIVSFLILVISFIGSAYAIINITLDIRGTVRMGNDKWNIYFDNLQEGDLSTNALEISKFRIDDNSTSILGLDVVFTTVDDYANYEFEVLNEGMFDAKISNIVNMTPSCVSRVGNVDEANMVCDNTKLEVTYKDGQYLKIGDKLLKNTKEKLVIKLFYDGKVMPKNEVKVSGLGTTILYIQD